MKKMEKKTEIKKPSEEVNTIKVGTFQLQTKSFWMGLVSILVLFLLAVIWLNTYYWYRVCEKLIDLQKAQTTVIKTTK